MIRALSFFCIFAILPPYHCENRLRFVACKCVAFLPALEQIHNIESRFLRFHCKDNLCDIIESCGESCNDEGRNPHQRKRTD
ncbi:MAG: hypothetical protein K2G68_07425 [Helicobacter sp.]|nr:hypothetical protein [Helicobacter sp.]